MNRRPPAILPVRAALATGVAVALWGLGWSPAAALRSEAPGTPGKPVGAETSQQKDQDDSRPDAENESAAGDERSALHDKALQLWHLKHDYDGALAAFNQAVEAEPRDLRLRLDRARFFYEISTVTEGEQSRRFRSWAEQELEFIASEEPDSRVAGVARDFLTAIRDERLLPDTSVSCPGEARKALEEAERHFGAGGYAEALLHYQAAAKACPQSPAIWLYYADAYYMLGDFQRAEALFRKALELDPWNRSAHRFQADTLARQGRLAEAFDEAVLAVISDPTYEAAWATLRDLAGAVGKTCRRHYARKPEVTRGADGEDNPHTGDFTITLPRTGPANPEGGPAEAAGPQDETADADSPDPALWLAYAMAKVAARMGEAPSNQDPEREPDSSDWTPLEVERYAVEAALETYRDLLRRQPEVIGDDGFWDMMDRAGQAGFLTEAVFLHLLDTELVPEYKIYRNVNQDRLASYVGQVLCAGESAPESDSNR